MLMYIFLSGILILVLKYFESIWNYWEERNVKFEEPILLFGNYRSVFLCFNRISDISREIYSKYKDEKMVGLFRSTSPQLYLKDLNLIEHVLVKDFNHFTDRSDLYLETTEPLTKNLFHAKGINWLTMRKKLNPAFSAKTLKTILPLVIETTEKYQKDFSEVIKENNIVEIQTILRQMTIDVIGSVALGLEPNSMVSEHAVFRQIVEGVVSESCGKKINSFIQKMCPSLYSLLEMRTMSFEEENYFTFIVKEVLSQRQSNGKQRNDFINQFLQLNNKNNSPSDSEKNITVDDLDIAAQAFAFYEVGYRSSLKIVTCALHELVLNPDVMKKVVDEIDIALIKTGGKLCYDAVLKMPYLDMVVHETLRKHPSCEVLSRICIEKYTFPQTNVTIDEGIQVIIPVLEIQNDPKYYPDPEKFLPERFTMEEKVKRNRMTFLSFGEGPRICIGTRFGKMLCMISIASILSKYKLESCEKTGKINSNSKGRKLWVKMSLRSDKYIPSEICDMDIDIDD